MRIINGRRVERGLIIDKPWIDLILRLIKTWEMRSKPTKIRGDIALIEKGTGMIVGLATLTDSPEEYSIEELICNQDKHQIDYMVQPELQKWNCPWILENIERIEPVPYTHKQGAVIWVKL
ncbi:ASCH domain-containing protein [Vibrio harveyi]|uniref:ASCH domain-containing protein n=1 Tax=Vibrio harveyi TaxID=669 RepID=UPI003CFB45B3